MLTKKLWLLAALIFAFQHIYANNLLLQKAPTLHLKTILQNKEASLSNLQGKTVVIEFWATYCTPCLQNLSHLNELADHFADSNVQFISITHEDEAKISAFLQKRTMKGWVGIDSANATCKAWGVNSYPQTFVIDKDGIIQYDAGPWQLTEKVIRSIASGSYLSPATQATQAVNTLGGFSPGDDPVFTANFDRKAVKYQHIIRQSVSYPGLGTKYGQKEVGITLLHKNLGEILAFLCERPSALRVINHSSIADTAHWDIIYANGRSGDFAKATKDIKEMAATTFGITITDTTQLVNVLVPVFQSGGKIREEKSINFDDPASHTLRSLTDLFTHAEEKGDMIIDFPASSDSLYIDIFDVLSGYYKMNSKQLLDWLGTQGITFSAQKKNVTMTLCRDNLGVLH